MLSEALRNGKNEVIELIEGYADVASNTAEYMEFLEEIANWCDEEYNEAADGSE